MNLRRTIPAFLMMIHFATMTASATMIQDIIDDGGSITVGHFTFSNFTVQATAIGGISPLADLIDIDFSEDANGAVTLNFHGAWSAGPLDWSVITSNIGFTVTVEEGYIAESAETAAIASTLLGDAFYLMDVGIFDGDPADPNAQSVAELLLQEGLGDDATGDSQILAAPLQEFYVNTSLFLRTQEDGAVVVLSEFAQTFNSTVVVVPEPTTLGLLAIGGATVFLKRFR